LQSDGKNSRNHGEIFWVNKSLSTEKTSRLEAARFSFERSLN